MKNLIHKYKEFFDTCLDSYELPNQPSNLYDPIRYILTLGGKRMRPILSLMAAEVFGKDFKEAKYAALSVELFHNFSLIHDDIMDKAPLRRGKETVHIKWNENVGILSGDQLLVEVYKCLANYEGAQLKSLLDVFNTTATQVCEGQQMDMDFETENTVSIQDYLKMIQYKTAVLLGCSLKMGAIIADASSEDAEQVYEFGLNLGTAFQLKDDYLDAFGDDEKFGKQVGGDIIANKKTYLLLRALEKANDAQKSSILSLFDESNEAKKVKEMLALYQELNIAEETTDQIEKYHQAAMLNLENLKVSDQAKLPLTELANYLLARTF